MGSRKAKSSGTGWEQICTSLSPDLVERLERLQARLSAEHPALDVSRAAVMRMCVIKGLDEIERATKGKK